MSIYKAGEELREKKKQILGSPSPTEISKAGNLIENPVEKGHDPILANPYIESYMRILKFDYQSQDWIEKPQEAKNK